MMNSLQGKAAIVTGAGGGIGRAISIAFAQAGAKVACVDLNLDKAEETARLGGEDSDAVRCDVSCESDTKAGVERAANVFGRVDILLNGAAMTDPSATVLELDLAAWNKVFATNVGGAFLMSRWAIPHMAAAGGGSIIHIASQLGTVGTPGRVAYCSTKGALITMAKAMPSDHAGQQMRVNALSPGAVETDRMILRFGDMKKARKALGPKHLV